MNIWWWWWKQRVFKPGSQPTPQYLPLAAVPHNDYDDCELDDDDHDDDEYGDDDHGGSEYGGDDENKEFLPPTPQYLPLEPCHIPFTIYWQVPPSFSLVDNDLFRASMMMMMMILSTIIFKSIFKEIYQTWSSYN